LSNSDNNQKLDPEIRNIMIIATTAMCVFIFVWIVVIPHPEQVKAWRDYMATTDCNHLAYYLINERGTPNDTKIASDNVQFVYDTYKAKGCIPLSP